MAFMDFFRGRNSVEDKVKTCLKYYNQHNIAALQQSLFELYQEFNCKGGGAKIINYPQKDELSECFAMMLNYDWMNEASIREVWAEDGFYCIATYLNADAKTKQDLLAGALDLFILLHAGERNLYPEFNDILRKAQMRSALPWSNEAKIFSQDDFRGGAEYVIRQFKFCAATIISEVETQHREIISSSLRPAYERAKKDFLFAAIPLDRQLEKMNFFATIIGSILEDM